MVGRDVVIVIDGATEVGVVMDVVADTVDAGNAVVVVMAIFPQPTAIVVNNNDAAMIIPICFSLNFPQNIFTR
jgi:hypothetical protein